MKHIRGAGGGGKGGGGGSSRAPVEAPDSLRSIAYARVLDLICEGEIEGLVDGAKSIYLDGTPLQSASGSFNFTGATFSTRNGTQGQSSIPGFPAVENEQAVAVEVTNPVPVVRRLTNPNLTAVRVTIGIPQLSNTDTSNGDVSGTSVRLAIDVQSNGGGYVSQELSREWTEAGVAVSGLTITTAANRTGVRFTLAAPTALNIDSPLQVRIEYRVVGASTWQLFEARTMQPRPGTPTRIDETADPLPPTPTNIQIGGLSPAAYEVRVVKTGGVGTPVIAAGGTTVVPGAFFTQVSTLPPQGLAPASSFVISGKTTSRYQRSYRIELSGPPPWDIRVRRLSGDSTNQYLQNATWWDSYTEIIDSKLRYPNSALVGLQIDSSQFQNIPQRGYDMKLLRVKVPTNYDPITRAYSGIWNGTFKVAWTDNPAWCFYDLLTNARYGLGDFIPEAQVDKWALYRIAQYCDELVPDGFGGTEPRFTCNIYLQTRAEAYRVLNDMASVFRAMVFWASGAITAVQDSPADAAYLYTPANVVEGLFNYSGSSAKVRHTVALVAWNDPADLYRQKVEYVEDAAGIARFGVVQTEIAAVACTSRGQAHRVGKWLLLSERLESDVVTFKVGLDGAIARPGQIIKVADPARAGVRLGGRIVSATTGSVTVDAPVTLAPATTYTLAVVKTDGTVEERAVTTGAGTVSSLAVSPAFTSAPEAQAIWILSSETVAPQLFRVVAVTEDDKHQFTISALAHFPDKYGAIEQGLTLEARSISVLSARPATPQNGVLDEDLYEGPTSIRIRATLSCDPIPGVSAYLFSYRRGDGNFVELAPSSVPSVQIDNILEGAYTVNIVAVNALGYRSAPYTFQADVLGALAPPDDVTNLQLAAQNGTALISWDLHPDLDVRIGGRIQLRYSSALTGATWNTALPVGDFAGASTGGVVPLLAGTYLARALDSSGVYSINATLVTTSAPSLLDYNVVVTQDQHPLWLGLFYEWDAIADLDAFLLPIDSTRADGLELAGTQIQLKSLLVWDDIVDLDAYIDPIDSAVVESGTYFFDQPIDVGSVYTCRVIADLEVASFNTLNIVDSWPSIDGLTDIDGIFDGADAQVQIFISTTNDNPAASPAWSDWRPLTLGEYTARAYRFYLQVNRGSTTTQQVAIKRATITIDVPDRVEGQDNILVPTTGLTISYARPFFAPPAVAVTAENMATGDYYEITAKTREGFTIRFKNSAGTGIARTMDWIAKGYGFTS